MRKRAVLGTLGFIIGLALLVIGTVALLIAVLGGQEYFEDRPPIAPLLIGGLVAAGGAYAHWRRFVVPITVAAGVLALGLAAVISIAYLLDNDMDGGSVRWLVLLSGLGTFALAMWWDVSDPERVTRRSDVAFWLHLLAAPLIAHALFTGIRDGDAGLVTALATVGRDLGITILAEGVECEEEARLLRAAGISLMQGYYFAKPALEDLPEVNGLSTCANAQAA